MLVLCCQSFFTRGQVSLPLLNQDGLSGSLRMHVQAPSQGVGTCRVQIYETQTNSQVEALTGRAGQTSASDA